MLFVYNAVEAASKQYARPDTVFMTRKLLNSFYFCTCIPRAALTRSFIPVLSPWYRNKIRLSRWSWTILTSLCRRATFPAPHLVCSLSATVTEPKINDYNYSLARRKKNIKDPDIQWNWINTATDSKNSPNSQGNWIFIDALPSCQSGPCH